MESSGRRAQGHSRRSAGGFMTRAGKEGRLLAVGFALALAAIAVECAMVRAETAGAETTRNDPASVSANATSETSTTPKAEANTPRRRSPADTTAEKGSVKPESGRKLDTATVREWLEELKTRYEASGRKSFLVERLLATARRAWEEGRFHDAASLLEEVEKTVGRVPRRPLKTTPPAAPTISEFIDAMARYAALRSRFPNDARLATAEELLKASENSLSRGNVTQARHLARRASEILTGLGKKIEKEEERDSGNRRRIRIDINTASAGELKRIPGMSDERVENLLWFRKWIGPFLTVEELRFVPGFSSEFVDVIRDRIRVGSPKEEKEE
ncbi:MAG: helix-hairpin-helix domain-containing protein [Candidatus Hydrogenedentota bacterium]|nr:MAG: helix-hairpin-helix domain-containing protein [Candidatus Hydrogenedentota bacterium]